MKTFKGVSASPGTAVAPAYVYRPDVYDIPAESPDVPQKALAQLAAALDEVAAALDAAATTATGAAAEILHAQAAIARDTALRRAAEPALMTGVHPARALIDAGNEFARTLEVSGNEYLAARAPDVRHICDLAARTLAGAPPRLPPRPVEPCIILANDLMPSDTADLDVSLVRGFATSGGSRTSHTSVVARGLGLPAVVGVRGIVDEAFEGRRIGLDGSEGVVVVEPDGATLLRLDASRRAHRWERERLRAAAGTGPARTADGTHIEVAANVRSVEELRAALAEGAEGVGLLRTELLYIDRDRPPTEEEQIELLGAMHGLLGERRLIVRTFDIGADKQVPFLPVRPERNPELGVRGLRLGRVHPDLLDSQLRAIAASAERGPTAVMAPMVATVEEAQWFTERVAAAGMPPEVEVGVMVEIPALALVAEQLDVGFMSIGTNDMMQYLFAADRRNGELAPLHDPFAPALLRAVASVCRGAGERAWVGVCGEAAAEPAWAVLAIGLGVTELSMQAVAIPAVRTALKKVTIEACREAAARALETHDAADSRAIASQLIKE
ncbi:MAG: phosphoenolpyruvate--protein phosphotransferase [Actinomycetota bacterium]